MRNDPREIFPGDRVKVFDARLFENDRDTPLSYTMQPATVVCRYGFKTVYRGDVVYDDAGRKFGEEQVWLYPDMVDVVFDRDGFESHGHFTTGVEAL